MPDKNAAPKFKGETFWTIQQTETHLVFGPLSRHFPFGYIMAATTVAVAAWMLHTRSRDLLQLVWPAVAAAFVLRLTRRQQAIFGWIVTKALFGLLAVIAVIIVFPMTLSQHQADAWSILTLGLIWFPLLGAFPKITPYQKYFTLVRLTVSVPVLIWFSKTTVFT